MGLKTLLFNLAKKKCTSTSEPNGEAYLDCVVAKLHAAWLLVVVEQNTSPDGVELHLSQVSLLNGCVELHGLRFLEGNGAGRQAVVDAKKNNDAIPV